MMPLPRPIMPKRAAAIMTRMNISANMTTHSTGKGFQKPDAWIQDPIAKKINLTAEDAEVRGGKTKK
jgi:hypothetical protein